MASDTTSHQGASDADHGGGAQGYSDTYFADMSQEGDGDSLFVLQVAQAAPAEGGTQGGAPVVVPVPQNEHVVRVNVTPGEVLELASPFDPNAALLGREANGNLAIKVGDVTVILEGFVDANSKVPVVVETSDGKPIDVATLLASTDPNADIQTAAGPGAAAGGQGGNGGVILGNLEGGAGLGGFGAVGAQDATSLTYGLIDNSIKQEIFTTTAGLLGPTSVGALSEPFLIDPADNNFYGNFADFFKHYEDTFNNTGQGGADFTGTQVGATTDFDTYLSETKLTTTVTHSSGAPDSLEITLTNADLAGITSEGQALHVDAEEGGTTIFVRREDGAIVLVIHSHEAGGDGALTTGNFEVDTYLVNHLDHNTSTTDTPFDNPQDILNIILNFEFAAGGEIPTGTGGSITVGVLDDVPISEGVFYVSADTTQPTDDFDNIDGYKGSSSVDFGHVDEDFLFGGNHDSDTGTPGDDTGATTVLGQLAINFGADGPAGFQLAGGGGNSEVSVNAFSSGPALQFHDNDTGGNYDVGDKFTVNGQQITSDGHDLSVLSHFTSGGQEFLIVGYQNEEDVKGDLNTNGEGGGWTVIFTVQMVVDPNSPDFQDFKFDLCGPIDHTFGDGIETDQLIKIGVIGHDGDGDGVTTAINIQVNDDVPVAVEDTATLTIAIPEAEPVVLAGLTTSDVVVVASVDGNVLDNDKQGGDDHITVTAAGFDGADTAVNPDDATPTVVQGTYGQLTIYADGHYTYELTDPNAAGKQDVFDYTATDADGDPSIANLTININGVTGALSEPFLLDPANSNSYSSFGDFIADYQNQVDNNGTGFADFNGTQSGPVSFSQYLQNTELSTLVAHSSVGTQTMVLTPPDLTGITSEGSALHSDVQDDGSTIFVRRDSDDAIVLVIHAHEAGSDNPGSTGDFQIDTYLVNHLDHPDGNSQDTLNLDFPYTLTEGGNPAGAGEITVGIVDDVPVSEGVFYVSADTTQPTEDFDNIDGYKGSTSTDFGHVDEDFLSTGNKDSDSGTPGDDTGATTVLGQLAINFGADGPAGFQLSGGDGNSDVRTDSFSSGPALQLHDNGTGGNYDVGDNFTVDGKQITSDGHDLVVLSHTTAGGFETLTVGYEAEKGIGAGTATLDGGVVIFTVQLIVDPNSPDFQSFEFDLKGPIDHTPSDGVETDQLISIGVLGHDGDGDGVTSAINIQVNDDVPIAVDDTNTVVAEVPSVELGVVTSDVVTFASIDGNVLDNDKQGGDDHIAVTSVGFDGGNQTVNPDDVTPTTVLGTYGQLTIYADGHYSYELTDPDGAGKQDVFQYTATDADGDPSSADLTIDIVPGVTGALSEPFLLDPANSNSYSNFGDFIADYQNAVDNTGTGFADYNGTQSGPVSFSDYLKNTELTTVVVHNSGAPETLSLTAPDLTGITSNGSALHSDIEEAGSTIFVRRDSDDAIVLVIHAHAAGNDDPSSTGNFEIDTYLVNHLDHPDPNSQDTLNLDFPYELSQGGSPTGSGEITVGVLDDVPVSGEVFYVSADTTQPTEEFDNIDGYKGFTTTDFGHVDEDFLSGGNKDGDTGTTGDGPGAVTVFGQLTMNFGADGPALGGGDGNSEVVKSLSSSEPALQLRDNDTGGNYAVGDKFTVDGKQITSDGHDLTVLSHTTSGGFDVIEVGYQPFIGDAATDVAIGPVVIFTVSLIVDPTSPDFQTFEFQLSGPIDHDPADGGESDQLIKVGVLGHDGDGDAGVTSIQIQVNDDVPIAVDDTNSVDGTFFTDALAAATVIGATTGNVLDNDKGGGDDHIDVVAAAAFGSTPDEGNVGGTVIVGQHGNLTIDALGNYTYSLTETGAVGQDDKFEYTIQDADGDKSSAELTIHVTGCSVSLASETLTSIVVPGEHLQGGSHGDVLQGGGGDDTLDGNAGNDILDGGAGRDVLHGGAGDDTLFGGTNADDLFGGNGKDTLDGGAGANRMSGGNGDDTFANVGAADLDGSNTFDGVHSIDGGQGWDTVDLSHLTGFDSSQAIHLENVEVLSFTGNGGTAVSLSYDAAFAVTQVGGIHALTINGDAGEDTVQLKASSGNSWTQTGTNVAGADGQLYDIYVAGHGANQVTVSVEHGVEVTTA